jgi:hypothetical protein
MHLQTDQHVYGVLPHFLRVTCRPSSRIQLQALASIPQSELYSSSAFEQFSMCRKRGKAHGLTSIRFSRTPAWSGRMTSHSNFEGAVDAIVLDMRVNCLQFLWKVRVELLRNVDMFIS